MKAANLLRGYWRDHAPVAGISAVLFVLCLIPVILVVLASLSTTVPRPGSSGLGSLTLANFASLMTPNAANAFVNSLSVGLGAAVIALLVGGSLAFLCARTDAPGKRFIFFVGISPMFIPALVGALAWSFLASPSSGFLNVALRNLGLDFAINIYSLGGLIFVLGIYYAPYGFLLMRSSFVLMSGDLEEAAAVHGASFARTLRTITLPLVLPALLGAGILVFALAMQNFPAAQVVGMPGRVDTLPTFIYRLMSATPAQSNQAAAVSVILTIGLLIFTVLQQRVVSRRKFTTVTGKGAIPRKVPLGGFKWLIMGYVLVYFLISIVLPMLALLVTAMQASPFFTKITQLMQPGALSLDRLSATLQSLDFHVGLRNSIIVSVLAAAFGTLLSFLASYIRHRTISGCRGLIDFIAMTPLAIPSIVMGMGLLWTWLFIPIPVYGTVWVLVIACIAVFFPQGYQGISASILQIGNDLEDSAVLLGANRSRAVRTITVPLMRVGITSTFLLFLMMSMRELSAVIFLFTSDTRILSIMVFENFENGQIQAAASVSVYYCIVIACIAILGQVLGSMEKRRSASQNQPHSLAS
ncbi:iron ABC transporter permease [uncultured Castellaniella sp.]|uniref:ABC transporter permease n=1 Tax=uncultured Castellaniella sp. TaxID=647907 RepID=UPI00260D7CE6|nr:iron ABC transporter permease [uncultured Castellaniella sp.]